MKVLLYRCIDRLRDIGLHVKIIVSDQGTNNVYLASPSKNLFFYNQEHKIFAMFDPPDLIKSMHNNLKTNGYEIDGHDI